MHKIIFSIFTLLLCTTLYSKTLTLVTEALKKIGYDVDIKFVP